MKQHQCTLPAIGSTVRVPSKVHITPKPGLKKQRRHNSDGGSSSSSTDNIVITVARRSIVAMHSDDTEYLSLVMDDLAPIPLNGRKEKFLVAPMFNSVGVEVRECEALACDVSPLLEFEQEEHNMLDDTIATTNNAQELVQKYKEYGDQLLRLNDYTSAISYYEAALSFVSSKFDNVGGTLVVRRKGHPVIAEVDCVDSDEAGNSQYDLTYLSGEEATVSEKSILLAVWTEDVLSLQTKILLNLSRCLLKLADVDSTRGNASCVGEKIGASAASSRRERYRQSAVLGCSIAMALCEYHMLECSDDSAFELDSLVEKARIVRARAFLGLMKMPNATIDAKKVISKNPSNREAQSLLVEIKAVEAHTKSVDKKLSKEVCRWVQTATTSSNGTEAMGRMNEDSVSDNEESDVSDVGDDSNDGKKMPTSDVDFWRLARGISMEIAGTIAFVIAMWVIYPRPKDQML